MKKKLKSSVIRKNPKLPEVTNVVPSYSSEKMMKKRVAKDLSTLEQNIFRKNDLTEKTNAKIFATARSQQLRNTRDIKEIAMGWNECDNFTFMIKYEDRYKVWNNFTIIYQGKTYVYNEYRLTNDGLQICDSPDRLISEKWRNLTAWEKRTVAFKHCLASVDGFYHENYTLYKNFTVFFKPTGQHFRKQDYGVISEHFAICSTKISLTCNNYFQVQLTVQYNVFDNFSFFYHNKIYDYREYRLRNESIQICASSHRRILDIWRTRNSWEKFQLSYSCPDHFTLTKPYYTVNKQFVVYYAARSQYFTRNDYAVSHGNPFICNESLRYQSTEYTKKDLLMCNDSIIKIKYNDEYKVWNDLSILYKNKTYHYTEYRILNDSIKICNSTDHFVNNIWKVRNYWVMEKRGSKVCNRRWKLYKPYYIFNKQFTIYVGPRSQYIPRSEYAVKNGEPFVCYQNLRPKSTEYTKEDLLICNQSIVNIKYNDEYKVFSNYSILFSNKIYDYTEYRVLNHSIKICNSTDNFIKGIWKLRNYWIIRTRTSKICDEEWETYKRHYTLNKKFTAYVAPHTQYFTRNEYDVINGRLRVCKKKLRPITTEYTKKDLLMCNDSIMYIKYEDQFKIWNNFSIIYESKVYSSTEYRVLNNFIKICNSPDTFVKEIWRLRNYFVKATMHTKNCNKPIRHIPLYQREYNVLNDFKLIVSNDMFLSKNYYGIFEGHPIICVTECANSTFTIKYKDEYRLWNNFSMSYKDQIYHYFEYRVTDDGLQICNSSARPIIKKWRNLVALEKRTTAYKRCSVSVDGFYHENYTVYKDFVVFFKLTRQNFSRLNYGVIAGYFVICSSKLQFSCNDRLAKIHYNEQYEVFNNFSLFYNNNIYDYREYRFSRKTLDMCDSKDSRVLEIWRTRNKWEKSLSARCFHPYKLNTRQYTVNKEFTLYSTDYGQSFKRYDYAVIDASPYVCNKKTMPNFIITDMRIVIMPLCALALSFVCLLLLLIVYFLLPELRTLPGLNLMSVSFSFLLWQIYLIVFLSVYSSLGNLVTIPCDRLFVIDKFITYSILMNAVVSIYHLRKTFCGNTLVKSDVNKWKGFLRYSLFSWGVPVVIAIVYIVLVKTDTLTSDLQILYMKGNFESSLRFYQRIELINEDAVEDKLIFYQHNVSMKVDVPTNIRIHKRILLKNEDYNDRMYHYITGDCMNVRITPSWAAAVDVYGIQGCLMTYITIMFILTACEIRRKLKAGSRLTQKTNDRKFVLFLKLSTTTALSYWFPLFISEMIDFSFDIKIALYTITLLSGAYIGIAFGFTRRNYQLLKKKYFPETNQRITRTN